MYKFLSASSHTKYRFSGSAYLSFITVTAAVSISTTKMWYLKPYIKWYHKSYYIIVWVLMEIVYSIFIGIIVGKIAGMIVGIVLQCRRDTLAHSSFFTQSKTSCGKYQHCTPLRSLITPLSPLEEAGRRPKLTPHPGSMLPNRSHLQRRAQKRSRAIVFS